MKIREKVEIEEKENFERVTEKERPEIQETERHYYFYTCIIIRHFGYLLVSLGVLLGEKERDKRKI